jgi:hypothetical protein
MNMNLRDFIRLADKYADLGSAVREQARAVFLEGEDLEDQNTNALEMIEDVLGDANAAGAADDSYDFDRLVDYLAELRQAREERRREQDRQNMDAEDYDAAYGED